MPLTIRGDLHGDGLRVTVVVSRWNAPVTDRLLAGALEVLLRSGVAEADVTVVEVPGAFELPQAAATAAAAGRTDAVVALGCLVQGETDHDRIIADACARGLMDVALATAVPVTFGVITARTQAQADARSDSQSRPGSVSRPGKGGHKGREAAEAAVRLAVVLRALRAADPEGGAHGCEEAGHDHGAACATPAPAARTKRAKAGPPKQAAGARASAARKRHRARS